MSRGFPLHCKRKAKSTVSEGKWTRLGGGAHGALVTAVAAANRRLYCKTFRSLIEAAVSNVSLFLTIITHKLLWTKK